MLTLRTHLQPKHELDYIQNENVKAELYEKLKMMLCMSVLNEISMQSKGEGSFHYLSSQKSLLAPLQPDFNM